MKNYFIISLTLMVFMACSKDDDSVNLTYVEGTYKAIEADFSYNWKGYMQIVIAKDALTTVDFDYKDATGNKKSETDSITYPMKPHPSVWLPKYDSCLMNSDILNFSDIDAISGATGSANTANEMMKTLLEAAKKGDTSEQVISAN